MTESEMVYDIIGHIIRRTAFEEKSIVVQTLEQARTNKCKVGDAIRVKVPKKFEPDLS